MSVGGFYEARVWDGVLVLDAGSAAECVGVGGVPLARIAWWRADWATDRLFVYPVAGPPVEIDYSGRGDAGQALTDLEELLVAHFRVSTVPPAPPSFGEVLGDLYALNDVIAAWAADNGIDPDDDQLIEAVHAAASALCDTGDTDRGR
ncbi:MAG TPA: hypothetical protein VNQ73_02675 [Ilumatobacter sp.]|nr:hypothetical protein [Ilumatobacter sp.]